MGRTDLWAITENYWAFFPSHIEENMIFRFSLISWKDPISKKMAREALG